MDGPKTITTMHIFLDSDTAWKLHIGEIPEKPTNITLNNMAWKAYYTAIAAIKQNALTVGNPILCPQNMSAVEPGKFYEWIGGYDIVGMGTVAILTLPEEHVLTKESISSMKFKPEEKKNTMENTERRIGYNKEFLNWIYERMINVHGENDMYDYMINFKYIIDQVTTASGNVAALKEEDPWSWVNYEAAISLTKPMLASPEINQYHEMVLSKAKQADAELASLRQQLETLRGFVMEVDASLYHGPDLEDKEIMQHYIEVFKIIKEEARKLLSK